LAIASVWAGLGKDALRLEFLDSSGSGDDWWVQIIVPASKKSTNQTIHFHLLEGHLLIDGQSIGKLPAQIRQSIVLQQLLSVHLFEYFCPFGHFWSGLKLTHLSSGEQILLTTPSNLPGMKYMLPQAVNKHVVHLGFRQENLVVRVLFQGELFELIPREIFGNPKNFDLPATLVMNCVHWISLRTGIIEIRQQPHIVRASLNFLRSFLGSQRSRALFKDIFHSVPASSNNRGIFQWKPKDSNWRLDYKTRQAHRRTSTLIDPRSRLFAHVAGIFDRFEYPQFLTVYQPAGKPLMVELRRLELQFIVNTRGLLESRQLRSEIDINQDIGTWYGLESRIVLRAITPYPDSVLQRQRSVIVPIGPLTCTIAGPHVRVQIQNSGIYGRFSVNEMLGRLDCPAEPRLLYLKVQLHAYTSFVTPDTLTGRTGTEEALHCLKSGFCQPWTPLSMGSCQILESVAKLTPRREYYPKDRKVMQKVFWDPELTATIQHDYFQTVVQEIWQKSEQLSAFSLAISEVPTLDRGSDDHLVLRSHLRRKIYQRPNAVSDEEKASPDILYEARDRIRASQGRSNIIECVTVIKHWPMKIDSTSDLAGILQNWAAIGGYQGFFDKVHLTDLLDVQFSDEWGSLVNLARSCSPGDSHRLMFLFALMSFRHDANMDVLRALLAFSILEELKTLTPPKWPSFHQFRNCQTPRIEYLMQLMKTCLVPYGEDERAIFQLNLNAKQRRKLEAAQVAYEQQQESDSRLLARHLLDQWPCLEPSLEGFTSSVLVDTRRALEVIRPEYERLFQNWELSLYLRTVQDVLEKHRSEPSVYSSAVEVREQDVIATRQSGGELPALQNLLYKAGPVALNIMHDFPSALQSLKSEGYNSTVSRAATDQKPVDERLGKTPQARKSLHPLSREIQELQKIIRSLLESKSLVRQQYGVDLKGSLSSLEKTDVGLREHCALVDAKQLSKDIAYAQSVVRQQFDALCRAFEIDDHRFTWLQKGGLWPSVTPVSLLESLRATSICVFGDRMKRCLVEYGLAITRMQQLFRIEDAFQQKKTQKLYDELDNPGHENWKPYERCDWLLLEIDSNILIRKSQIDVALAIIGPESGSNTVLQMNMGQGWFQTSKLIQ
jgi:hypothetical protein